MGWVRAGLLALTLALPVPGLAQTILDGPTRQVDGTGALLPRVGTSVVTKSEALLGPVNGGAAPQASASNPSAPNYDDWVKLADRAESDLLKEDISSVSLESTRALLVEWREALSGAENYNATRISTVRSQIAALGPVPEEGHEEAPEIAKRRAQLNDQLAKLQAPALEADEAYKRAVGLISEIDRVLRARQADELLRLWPTPVNPANWSEGFSALKNTSQMIYSEAKQRWNSPAARATLADKLPMVVVLLALAVLILWRGRRFIDRLTYRLQNRSSARGREILAFVTSVGQLVIPVIGLVLFAVALLLTGMLGVVSTVIVKGLPSIGMIFFSAIWLGGRVFPAGDRAEAAMKMTPESRAEGRFLSAMLGALLALDRLRQISMDQFDGSEAAFSVVSFPIIALTGVFLFRMGQLIVRYTKSETAPDATRVFATRIIGVIGRAAMALGAVGPVLAAIGYVTAAAELVFSGTLTLALAGLLSVLERLITSAYSLITRENEAEADSALFPVLLTFMLALSSMPVLALIWGARSSDLGDLWSSFRNGVSIGDTQISPSALFFFLLVFAVGYGATRLMKEVLRVSILPRTKLDHGGQTAVISGVGYIGIFLSSLIAINAAGIDLSGFAMVASALSLGIGFGMQTIVSNFVSGIILLVERPISEGDWIEVAGVQGVVQTISVRSTRIQTFDRSDVIVPNSDLITGRVTNWTRFNMSGRLIVPISVAYGTDSRRVEQVLREIAEAQPLALLNPPPTIAFMGFSADAMSFEMRMILRDVNYSLQVRTEVNHQIVERFGKEGFVIPFAQRDINLHNVDALRQVLAPLAAPKPVQDRAGPVAPHPPAPELTSEQASPHGDAHHDGSDAGDAEETR
jgi:small-conductance mechanosensitive channel